MCVCTNTHSGKFNYNTVIPDIERCRRNVNSLILRHALIRLPNWTTYVVMLFKGTLSVTNLSQPL